MQKSQLRQHIDEAVAYIRQHVTDVPEVAIILGTGLGGISDVIEDKKEIPYSDIPHFPVSTVMSHAGNLVFGQISGKSVVMMAGRVHYYEGYTMQQVTFPVRVMKYLGANTLFISNAVGGMNPQYRKGDIVLTTDHINLMGDNPLIGPNDDTIGPRFPDMSAPYDRELIDLAEDVALNEKIRTQRGVMVAVAGPNLETPAEYRFLRAIGADTVGMSSVPENLVGVHMGMRVMTFSIVTDLCFPDFLAPVNIEEILQIAAESGKKLERLICKLLERME
ncbi:MAG: purine-nucleoside phosphorylase [Gemmatimonadetes bacterium]|nr:MAG: purine-nucleoside phosphorylase [Gemmatimonadota bacterium]